MATEPNVQEVKHVKLRIAVAIGFCLLAAYFFSQGITGMTEKSSGWSEIYANIKDGSWGSEFVFNYNLGASGITAMEENRKVTDLYSETMTQVYSQLNNDKDFEGVHNVHYINEHPNKEIEVDDLLYQVFEKLQKDKQRQLYLAPINREYSNIFLADSKEEAYEYDPTVNEQVREHYQNYASYALDEEAVQLELLGNNKVRLHVSDEYMELAKKENITSFIDLGFMKNAFVVDYIAERFIEEGHKAGVISSYDGYTRSFDETNSELITKIYDLEGTDLFNVALMEYKGPRSIVYLHNYPLSKEDEIYYYAGEDKKFRTRYISAEEGMCLSSKDELLMQSTDQGCAEILLEMMPVYIKGEFDKDKIEELSKRGIKSVYCEDKKVFNNDTTVKFEKLYKRDGIEYSME